MKHRKIPTYIKNKLAPDTISTLNASVNGVTFARYSVKMDIEFAGIRHCLYYNLAEFGDYDTATKVALETYAFLKERIRAKIGYRGVMSKHMGIIIVDRHTNDGMSYAMRITYYCPDSGKDKQSWLLIGHTPPTPGQWLHARHTGLWFREMESMCRDEGLRPPLELLKEWKSRRLYRSDEPIDFNEL